MSELSSFARFVLEHEQNDIYALRLAAGKYKDMDVKRACLTIECRRKLKNKVPSFYACPEFRYVASLPAEQCSGEKTAAYKARIAAEILAGDSPVAGEAVAASSALTPRTEDRHIANLKGFRCIADLTGGMGVDAMAFAAVADEVLYNEMNAELAEATAHNFGLLGITNVRFSSRELKPASAAAHTDAAESGPRPADAGSLDAILGDFEPDLIFLDPARRSDSGSKVFRLEDCTPNILLLKDELLARCRHLLLKLSPMADISAVCKALGPRVKRVILVASEDECKEMLVEMDRECDGPYRIVVPGNVSNSPEEGGYFSFFPEEEKALAPILLPSLDFLQPENGLPSEYGSSSRCSLLFEPGKALMKSGAYKLLAQRYGLYQLAPDTHIYAVPDGQKPPQHHSSRLPRGLGKCYRIVYREPMTSSSLESFKKKWPPMDVTARNIPLTSEALKQRLWGKAPKGNKSKPGERHHLFALSCLDQQGRQENTLLVTTPLREC